MPAQLSYALNNKAGIPGMLFDNDESTYIDSKPCGAVALQAGVMVELVNGLLIVAQGTGNPSANVAWGVVVFKDSMEPNPTTGQGEYLPGMDVPVLRRGRIWALCASGATFAQGVAVNYTHSSTAATPQGVFTNAAAAGGVGVEISATKAIWYQDGGLVAATPPIAAIELNLP